MSDTHESLASDAARAPRAVGTVCSPELAATARYLASALALLALVGLIPAGMAGYNSYAEFQQVALPAWALTLLVVSTLQLAYALYLAQLPDWVSIAVVTVMTLGTATLYATFLGLRLLVMDAHPLMRALQLDTNPYHRGQEAGWAFIMLMLTGLVAFFAGRATTYWRR